MRDRNPGHTPASPTSWLLPLSLATLGALGWACQYGDPNDEGTLDGDDDPFEQSDVSRQDVLASIARNVLVPSTESFADTAQALRTATQAHHDALAASPDAGQAELETAQQAWRDAMHSWQRLEVMQVGPAAPSLVGIGGEDLRDSIYSWPTTDSCSVDRVLAEGSYADDDFFTTQLVWAHGLDALEYLLFAHDADHSCPSQVQLDGPWASLSFEELELRRAEYAVVLAARIVTQASTLAARWSPDDDDFATALALPGEAPSPYRSDAEALDEVFRAMFYIDKQTKDGKLGLPLGLVEGCAAAPCIDLAEMPWSGESTASIIANLEGLRLMIHGGPDPQTADGFDDLLDGIDQGPVADELLARITLAIEAAQALDSPLQPALGASPQQVTELHAAVKDVSDLLKGPFVMALMLTVPAEGAGDND